MSISPATGVYSSGATFISRVVVNTNSQSINAAEGTVKFNPQELTVVSVDRSNSIFNLWVTEPTFSNSAGTITFSGGLPTGYTGSSGSIFNITFRTKNASNAKVSITGAAVLANDGRGTNLLSSMNGAAYTVQALSNNPIPEVVEYVAPANTPSAPKITSPSHPNSESWYTNKNAILNWELPNEVTSIRTLLDSNQSSIPTRVYEQPIKGINLEDLAEGVSYFHLQFKNSDGWGKVSHYRLAIDSQKPSSFEISLPENADLANPIQTLNLKVVDETSKIIKYLVRIDDNEAYEYIDNSGTSTITLPELSPGRHSFIIEAFDQAGNSIIGQFAFTALAFDRPIFTDYPSEINEEVIPVIKGLTRPNSEVEITVQKTGATATIYNVNSDSSGIFILIPEGTFTTGVYELSAKAKDQFGAQSEISEIIRIAVQEPGYVQIGNFLVNILSIFIPLFAMVVLLAISIWFLALYLRRFRKKVSVESKEVEVMLDREFKSLHQVMKIQQQKLADSHKSKKLTKIEEDMFYTLEAALSMAQSKVEKEVIDVERLVQKK